MATYYIFGPPINVEPSLEPPVICEFCNKHSSHKCTECGTTVCDEHYHDVGNGDYVCNYCLENNDD